MRHIIGDVHGEAAALEGLVSLVRSSDPQAEFYFVGDFVDRGPDSQAVVEMVIDLGGRACRGNHDDVMDMIVNGTSVSATGGPIEAAQQACWFMQYGMTSTLKSYGVSADHLYRLTDALDKATNVTSISIDNMFSEEDNAEDRRNALVEEALEEIRAFIPEKHRKFFRELPVIYDAGDFFMVHAHLSADATGDLTALINGSPDLKQNAIWGRFNFSEIRRPKMWGKQGFFGHTPTNHYGFRGEVVAGDSMTLIDTGATFGDNLTAYCVETGDTIRVDKSGTQV